MTTREEKIKKINEELELLSDEELENVVGGYGYEVLELYNAMKGNPKFNKYFTNPTSSRTSHTVMINEVKTALETVFSGVELKVSLSFGDGYYMYPNDYLKAEPVYVEGQDGVDHYIYRRISHSQMMDMIKNA